MSKLEIVEENVPNPTHRLEELEGGEPFIVASGNSWEELERQGGRLLLKVDLDEGKAFDPGSGALLNLASGLLVRKVEAQLRWKDWRPREDQ